MSNLQEEHAFCRRESRGGSQVSVTKVLAGCVLGLLDLADYPQVYTSHLALLLRRLTVDMSSLDGLSVNDRIKQYSSCVPNLM